MRFKIFFALWVSAFLLPGVAVANDGFQTLEKKDLFRVFEEFVTAQNLWPVEDLEIMKFSARPEEIRLPKGMVEYRIAGAVPKRHPGFKSFILIISVGGRDQGRVRLSGELHRFGRVACTVRKVNRGRVVRQEDLKMVRSDLTWQSEGVIYNLDKVVGKKLRSSLRAGSILLERHLEERPVVNRGDTVTIVAGRAPLMVSAPGRVREAGVTGELVRVKNMMSRKILLARVRDDRTVVVDY